MTFERSVDYPLILAIVTEPQCYRRMTGGAAVDAAFTVSALSGIEYIVARDDGGRARAVFLLVDGAEVHFCFVPEAWGHTEAIARGFLAWVWANTGQTRLVGPVPRHNRLALRLALKVGFAVYGALNDLVLLEIRKP